MFMDGFDGLGGPLGLNGWDGVDGINPMSGLLWQLFECSGEPGYYMLLKNLDGLDYEETDHRRD